MFDDFIAAAGWLIKSKYTSSNKLAIQGASNGGLLVGAVANQRPDLFKVVPSHAGVDGHAALHTFTLAGTGRRITAGATATKLSSKRCMAYRRSTTPSRGRNTGGVIHTADHDDSRGAAHC